MDSRLINILKGRKVRDTDSIIFSLRTIDAGGVEHSGYLCMLFLISISSCCGSGQCVDTLTQLSFSDVFILEACTKLHGQLGPSCGGSPILWLCYSAESVYRQHKTRVLCDFENSQGGAHALFKSHPMAYWKIQRLWAAVTVSYSELVCSTYAVVLRFSMMSKGLELLSQSWAWHVLVVAVGRNVGLWCFKEPEKGELYSWLVHVFLQRAGQEREKHFTLCHSVFLSLSLWESTWRSRKGVLKACLAFTGVPVPWWDVFSLCPYLTFPLCTQEVVAQGIWRAKHACIYGTSGNKQYIQLKGLWLWKMSLDCVYSHFFVAPNSAEGLG